LPLENLEPLVERAASGDALAVDELMAAGRERLRQTIGARMHPRLAGRCDASDIVQDAMADAVRRLPEYLAKRPVPFFLWLRQIGLDRLADYCRRHLYAQARSVYREENVELSDDSIANLASHLAASSQGLQSRLIQEETERQLRACLEKLRPDERELLLMRYIEQLAVSEIAAALGVKERAAKSRVRRALEKLQGLMEEGS
jgi:RNA polymerase sigma-70 factor (ECF subfamily)